MAAGEGKEMSGKAWVEKDKAWAVEQNAVTRRMLIDGLRQLGVKDGDCILPHVGFKNFGLFAGGVQVFVEALISAVGDQGTVMMPASSGDVSDPRHWRFPPLAPEVAEEVAQDIPAYDPLLTPTRGLSAVAEYFRTYPGTLRSAHPSSSFSARGRLAEWLISPHGLHYRYGPDTPLGRFYAADGLVVLLGSRWNAVSLFNHVEFHMDVHVPESKSVPILRNGVKEWVHCDDILYAHYWYEDGVRHLIDSKIARRVPIGPADCLAFRAKEATAALVEWRRANNLINEP